MLEGHALEGRQQPSIRQLMAVRNVQPGQAHPLQVSQSLICEPGAVRQAKVRQRHALKDPHAGVWETRTPPKAQPFQGHPFQLLDTLILQLREPVEVQDIQGLTSQICKARACHLVVAMHVQMFQAQPAQMVQAGVCQKHVPPNVQACERQALQGLQRRILHAPKGGGGVTYFYLLRPSSTLNEFLGGSWEAHHKGAPRDSPGRKANWGGGGRGGEGNHCFIVDGMQYFMVWNIWIALRILM